MTPYTAAQTPKATPLLNRARLFLDLGGNIWRPDRDPWVYEEMLWLVELHGVRDNADRGVCQLDQTGDRSDRQTCERWAA